MDIFWWIVGFVWVAGWLKVLATVNYTRENNNIPYPCEEVKYVMPAVLFFSWPYFYFYMKA